MKRNDTMSWCNRCDMPVPDKDWDKHVCSPYHKSLEPKKR